MTDASHDRLALQRALHVLVQPYRKAMSTEALHDAMMEAISVYGPPSSDQLIHLDNHPLTYQWNFRDPDALLAQMETVLSIGAISVPKHTTMAPLEPVVVAISTGYGEDVKLTGTIVQLFDDLAAIQLNALDGNIHHTLHFGLEQLQRYGAPPHQVTLPPAIEAYLSELEQVSTSEDVHAPPTQPIEPPTQTPASPTIVQEIAPTQPTPAAPSTRQKHIEYGQPARRHAKKMHLRSWSRGEQDVAQIMMAISNQTGPHELTIHTTEHEDPYVILLNHDDIVAAIGPGLDAAEDSIMSIARINHSTLTRAKQMADDFDMTIGEALLDLDEITYDMLQTAMHDRMMALIAPLWDANITRATHHQLDLIPIRRLAKPISVIEQVYIHHDTHHHNTTRREIPNEQTTCFQYVESLDLLSKLPLDHRQNNLMRAIAEDMHTLHDVQLITTMSKQDTIHTLYVFRDMGLVTMRQNAVKSRQVNRARVALETQIKKAQDSNDFELLGVHWSSHGPEIELAYQEKLNELNTPEMAAQPELSRELKAIYARAHHRLSRHSTRDAYRRTIIDDYAIRTTLSLFYDQIEAAKLKRDIDRMIDCYEHIIELNKHDAQAKRKLDSLRQARG